MKVENLYDNRVIMPAVHIRTAGRIGRPVQKERHGDKSNSSPGGVTLLNGIA